MLYLCPRILQLSGLSSPAVWRAAWAAATRREIAIGGVTILQRVLACLKPQCTSLVINANGDPARFADTKLPVVADSVPDFAGPLAGILAGLDWAALHTPKCEWLASVPGDCPFLPNDLVTRLQAARVAAVAPLVQWNTCNAGFSDRTISMSATGSPRARNKFPARTLSRSSKSSKFGPRTPSPGTSSTKMNHHPSSLDCWTRNGYRRNSVMALVPTTVSRSSLNFPFPQPLRCGRLGRMNQNGRHARVSA
jgi:hypothetical protein